MLKGCGLVVLGNCVLSFDALGSDLSCEPENYRLKWKNNRTIHPIKADSEVEVNLKSASIF